MIKENKLKVAISLLATLLPMVIGLCLWGKISDGHEHVMRSVKIMSVFGIPLIMFVLNVLCILFTHYDTKRVEQHKKIIAMVLWIMPLISLYVSLIFYFVLLGWNINIQLTTSLIMGVLFIVLGNYMPKSKQNRTFGIKIRWALANEDNWNATHRFAGKMWFVTGFLVLLLGFLPLTAFLITFICIVIAATVIPVLYSYYYYKSNVKCGKQTEEDYDFVSNAYSKKTIAIVISVICIILAFCVVLMFTGDIKVNLGDDSLEIVASYHADESIPYADIDSVEYRENSDKGTRVMGFGSPRLLMGAFKNDEFGVFTRFSYTKCKSDIIITVGENKIAISCKTDSETRALYDALAEKLGE